MTLMNRAFTLIELLIVVAIIAILAAIAVPNFLEAQTRAKVSRSANDLRTQSLAMEAYFIDHNSYTRDSDSSLDSKDTGKDTAFNPANPNWGKVANGALQLTTPIAYMSSLLSDPFVVDIQVDGAGAQGYRIGSGSWSYADTSLNPDSKDGQGSAAVFAANGRVATYVLIGVGPDKNRARISYKCFPYMSTNTGVGKEGTPSTGLNSKGQPFCYTDYDPTNGTVSVGDLYRFGGSPTSGRWMRNGQIIGSATPAPSAF